MTVNDASRLGYNDDTQSLSTNENNDDDNNSDNNNNNEDETIDTNQDGGMDGHEDDEDDTFANAVGYTPLEDGNFLNDDDPAGGGIMFYCPPENTSYWESDDDEDGEEEEESHDFVANFGNPSEDTNVNEDIPFQFDSIASSALRQLEEEYSSVQITADVGRSSIAAADALQHQSSDQNSSSSPGALANDVVESSSDDKNATSSHLNDEGDEVAKSIPTLPIETSDGDTEDNNDQHQPQAQEININTKVKKSIVSATQDVDSKEIDVDVKRIQNAIKAIRIQKPKLTADLDAAWEKNLTTTGGGGKVAAAAPIHHQSAATASSSEIMTTIAASKAAVLLPKSTTTSTTHSIIPSAPFAAFKQTSTSDKAIRASANLTRSATLAEAMVRLFPTINPQTLSNNSSVFTLHILGADRVECETKETVRCALCPFVRWMDAALAATTATGDSVPTKMQEIRIVLLGPNIPPQCTNWSIDLLPKRSYGSGGHLRVADATFVNCLYHEHLHHMILSHEEAKANTSSGEIFTTPSFPDLMVSFNAGIWGYSDWIPTIDYLMRCATPMPIPFVITSYTLEEAEDDAEVILDSIEKKKKKMADAKNTNNQDDDAQVVAMIDNWEKCLWRPELNPFRSRQRRKTDTAMEGRVYYENGAWQTWMVGKGANTFQKLGKEEGVIQ